MTWIKIDNRAVDHPKVAALSASAFRWWIKALCYSGAFLTDGLLPPVFWKQVPKAIRSELSTGKLWDWADPNFLVHDYHHHQSRKEDVEYEKGRNRQKAAAYRERKRQEKASVTGNVTGHSSPPSDRIVPNPDSRDQIVDIDSRGQRQKNGHAAAPLILSPLAYERRKAQCAYVGARLEVPHGLHGDMRKLLGGANAETDLLAWYADLDAEIEASGEKITPDVFRWLKARYAQWTDAAGREKTTAEIMAEIALLPKGIGR